ncbi:hypothetical protein GCM10025868_36580 [Angustibacter aerolatus]|uniref:Polysaccharide pyruvyl transferase domain-containing protein n=1 Tax=Angustibacter aerolatus TaxID=1162965 RepID=A0ABQ6JJN2_9ACTN|nr:polysaccharide pyruvyl transferase family protein [Angustibacter aerolatus]GMA88408.1 hypothetical protein GCM10025868_36580 [Angustibacter aerolatus]
MERLTIPVVVVGVGAQAPISGRLQRLAPLETSVRRFVSAVLDRSATIGVRGEVTEGYLRRLGFSDVEVIGCPSMFQAGDRLAVRTPPQRVDRRTKVALTLSPYVRAMEPALQVLLERHPRTVYVPQEPEDAAAHAAGPRGRRAEHRRLVPGAPRAPVVHQQPHAVLRRPDDVAPVPCRPRRDGRHPHPRHHHVVAGGDAGAAGGARLAHARAWPTTTRSRT